MRETARTPVPDSDRRPEGSRSRFVMGAVLAWMVVVGAGFFLLERYSGTPGSRFSSPLQWPEGSRIAFRSGAPSLLVFLHPQCPCSRATLRELGRLLVGIRERVHVHALFVRPHGFGDEQMRDGLWEEAERLLGPILEVDPCGEEARRFGAATSGHVLAYDGSGRILFSGGITPSRGHSGDCKGSVLLRASLTGTLHEATSTPVFGCPLFDASPQTEANAGCPSCRE